MVEEVLKNLTSAETNKLLNMPIPLPKERAQVILKEWKDSKGHIWNFFNPKNDKKRFVFRECGRC